MSMKEEAKREMKLLVSFVAMVFVGLGNKIFQKLQTIPMHNYPAFLNLLTTFVYIPISFAYILPMIKYGSAITWEQQNIPKSKFAVMGGLDSIAGILQVFAATYLSGSLIILLGQAAIPISMLISGLLLKAKYSGYQYVGAVVVTLGLLIVLGSGNSSSSSSVNPHIAVLWSIIMIFSCVPMCLSSVYKEKTLGEVKLDAVYLNGWIAVFQFLFAVPLTFPASLVGDHPVTPRELPQNMYNGMKCYFGQNTITDGPHKDNCEKATIYVTAYLIFNVTYNLLIILILKFGSANILWLAMTIMVPLGNVAFTFPFMPEHQPLHAKDIAGLLFIMLGLFVYRFLEDLMVSWNKLKSNTLDEKVSADDDLKRALISSDGNSSDEFE
ncbi:UAA transporter [Plasmopara halstedii]|uniref:UAA transporter n=1 Tax=Plasmopara halstedii TaxID=4781 RepID=A0A0P1AMR1_PLAHL|nr:UAA transporter [Plasmopara halstedii]CEG42496.1 UAA transporter [Plasmopara halstedii]|eukprot:XP_024578865.1 UAA transporter [Plasmopara halstedii]